MLSNDSRGTLMSYTDHSVQRCFKSNTPTDWISQHCLVITWPSKRICSSELVRAAVWTVIRADKRSVWRDSNESRGFVPLLVHIISNIFQTFHIVLEENYIAIIIIIELSPSPNSRALERAQTHTSEAHAHTSEAHAHRQPCQLRVNTELSSALLSMDE